MTVHVHTDASVTRLGMGYGWAAILEERVLLQGFGPIRSRWCPNRGSTQAEALALHQAILDTAHLSPRSFFTDALSLISLHKRSVNAEVEAINSVLRLISIAGPLQFDNKSHWSRMAHNLSRRGAGGLGVPYQGHLYSDSWQKSASHFVMPKCI
jgi:hypothetical protein